MVTQKHPKDHKSRALCSVLCIFCVCTPKTVDFLDKNSQMLFFFASCMQPRWRHSALGAESAHPCSRPLLPWEKFKF